MNQAECQQEIMRMIQRYAVAMMTGELLLGSGTLVSLGSRFGILTAWHVFYDKRELRRPFSSDKKARVTVAYITDIPHNTEFEFHHLDLRGTDNWQEIEWGPDLLFIALPESPQLQSLRAKKSFVRLDREPESLVAKARKKESCVWCLVGHPGVEKHEVPASHGFDKVLAAPAKISFGGMSTTHAHNGWDYLDIPVQGTDPAIPSSFGGVSGGGFWKTPIVFQGEDITDVGESHLMGVAFLEVYRQGPNRFLRCHGPESIYIKLKEHLDGPQEN